MNPSGSISEPLSFWSRGTPDQRRAFLAAWLGWILDAFDFTIFLLVMPEIGKSLHLGREALGGAVTATLLGRVVGGPVGGWLCDRIGRVKPMMFSLIAYAVFDTLIVFATGYQQILVLRFLFGVGMGVEWTAGASLAMEHWPAETRGVASGVLQGSWAFGYILATICYRFLTPSLGWRSLFLLALAPALFAIYVRFRVKESPVWLAAGRQVSRLGEVVRGHGRAILTGSLVLGGGYIAYYALMSFYPTLIRDRGFGPSELTALVITLNVGQLFGSVACGAFSERAGRRIAIAVFALATIPAALLWLLPSSLVLLMVGAFAGGFVGTGWIGTTPSYLAEQFPTSLRAAGTGTAYHLGAIIGSLAPLVVPVLAQRGTLRLEVAMIACATVGCLIVASSVWLRPERRGVSLAD